MPHPARRIEAFSDGVMAIAITLLVIEIAVPGEDEDVGQALRDLVPEVLSFVLSFLVIGRYWIAHHATLDRAKTIDDGLHWRNLVFLLCIAFLPFPTALLGERLGEPLAAVVYAAAMVLVGAASSTLWIYVAKRNGVPPQTLQSVRNRAAAIPAIFLISIPLAFVDLGGVTAAPIAWLAALLGLFIRSRLLAAR